MAFVGRSKKLQQQFETPEEMYLRGALPRKPGAVSSLWIHQGDVLRAYAEKHQGTADVALELPTGTGKTLPGLLISEWVRRKMEGPVLYATPTKQLAQQALTTANIEGVPARLLVGNHRYWSASHLSEVESGEMIAITTYSSIFNSSPKLPEPRLVVLDDAHAGEQFVGEKYGVSISRSESEAEYFEVLEALRPFLTGLQIQRLQGQPDPGVHHQVRLILPAVLTEALQKLDASLARLGEPHKFEFAMIRTGLTSCCVYLSYSGIQIRPMIPPTFENKIFSRARQRVYLSATLGGAGELERAFGRAEVIRMPLPTKTPPRSGRRLFVFPDLTEGGDAVGVTRDVIALTNKALVLSQSSSSETDTITRDLAGEGVPTFGRETVERGLEEFSTAAKGLLGLANRYDGMDLPGEACRIVVLVGKPDAASLQERFLSERAQANAALAERLRTRIVQGAGRCTRGPNDYAVVVVLGSDLTRYFSQVENTAALDPELQAEIQFGWENSRGQSVEGIMQNVRIFLEHEAEWQEDGEPLVAEFREAAKKTDPSGTLALGEAARLEVEAWRLAFSEAWIEASQKLESAARAVGQGGEATRGYRGLLLHVAGVWLHRGAQGEGNRSHARQLLRDAENASARGAWLKEMMEPSGESETPLAGSDIVAINAITARISGQLKPNKIEAGIELMRMGLDQHHAGPYEEALTLLGEFLGASAEKPSGQGRCDSAWVWDNALWVTLEAKSEQHSDGLLPLKDIRQANTQLDQQATDRGVGHAPPGSCTILISDRLTVSADHAPSANSHVYVASTEVVRQLAGDVENVWKHLLAATSKQGTHPSMKRQVQEVMSENGCLPTQVMDRLMQERIKPIC